jgi:mono/diheme cytochrome c family protein
MGYRARALAGVPLCNRGISIVQPSQSNQRNENIAQKIGNWLGYALLALLGLALSAYGYAWWNVQGRLNQVYPTHTPGIVIPADSAAVARGAHLYVVHACRDCHGANGAGRVVLDNPLMGRLVARNLTRGKGGLPARRLGRRRLAAHPQNRGKPASTPCYR